MRTIGPYTTQQGLVNLNKPRVALDVILGLVNQDHDQLEYGEYVSRMREQLSDAYEKAIATTRKAQGNQKNDFDRNARNAALEVGDVVLVKVLTFDGKHKLAEKWEECPSVVVEKPNPDIPVYVAPFWWCSIAPFW